MNTDKKTNKAQSAIKNNIPLQADRKLRILLFYPPITIHRHDVGNPSKAPLLGLGYIAANLKHHGHEVKVVDCIDDPNHKTPMDSRLTRFGYIDSEIRNEISTFQPNVIGISCMYTSYFRDALNIARLAKQWDGETLTVMGGSHVTTFPELVMKDKNVDCVVIGEGENTIIEIINRYQQGTALNDIKGIVHRINGKVVQEAPRDRLDDLDQLPIPDWKIMEKEKKKIDEINMNNPFLMRQPVGYMITSRGCPRKCAFCSVHLSMGRKWRARSAANVVDEIEYLVHTLGGKEIHFMDDNVSVSKKRLVNICREILRRKIDIKWTTPTGIGYWNLDEETLSLMKLSGCYRITLGIESGSEETLRLIGKRHNWEKVKSVITYANRIGMWTASTFIIGFPHEHETDFMMTLDTATSLGLDFAVFYLIIPQPGTSIYSLYKEKGLLNLDPYLDTEYPGEDKYRLATIYTNGTATKHFTQKELQLWLAKLYRKFLLFKLSSPKTYMNLARKVHSVEDFRYLSRLARLGIQYLYRSIFSKFNYEMLRNKKELVSDDSGMRKGIKCDTA